MQPLRKDPEEKLYPLTYSCALNKGWKRIHLIGMEMRTFEENSKNDKYYEAIKLILCLQIPPSPPSKVSRDTETKSRREIDGIFSYLKENK